MWKRFRRLVLLYYQQTFYHEKLYLIGSSSKMLSHKIFRLYMVKLWNLFAANKSLKNVDKLLLYGKRFLQKCIEPVPKFSLLEKNDSNNLLLCK